MGKLTQKVALVTGASKGIGAEIAKTLAAEGAAVAVNYASSKSGADAVVAAITEAGGRAVALHGDVSKREDAQRLVAETVRAFGRLDVLVNNAGVYEFGTLEQVTEESFDRQFGVNVRGLLWATQAALPHLGEGAAVVNVGSLVSAATPPATSVYSATKGAVDAITGVLAQELGARKIRVNSVNPGPVDTEGAAELMQSDMIHEYVARTPLGRVGRVRDIATITAFLASDDAAWLTGQHLVATGGLR